MEHIENSWCERCPKHVVVLICTYVWLRVLQVMPATEPDRPSPSHCLPMPELI